MFMKTSLLSLAGLASLLIAGNLAYSQTPVAYWKLEDNTVKDEIGNLPSSLVGSSADPFVTAAIGKGLDFSKLDAATGAVSVPTAPAIEFTTGSFSIAATVTLNKTVSTEQDIVAKGWRSNSVDGHWYALYISSNASKYTFAVDDNYDYEHSGTPGKTALTYAVPAEQNGWVHLVAVRNTAAGLLELYINGTQVGTTTDNTKESIASPNYPLLIGNTNEGNSLYGGIIDEVRIYNVALTQAEITTLFAASNVKTDGTVNVDEMAVSKIGIYPNPASETICIKNLTEPSTVKIYNAEGKLLLTSDVHSGSDKINVSHLNRGLYLISVNNNNRLVTRTSFIKQ